MTAKKYTYFIGVDVSRKEIDYAIIHDKKLLFHREAKNVPDSIDSFIQE